LSGKGARTVGWAVTQLEYVKGRDRASAEVWKCQGPLSLVQELMMGACVWRIGDKQQWGTAEVLPFM